MRLIRIFLLTTASAACASPGMPPGGPPDVEAPRLVAVAPDSGRVGVAPRSVVFRFDEVVSESPPGAATLASLFVVSPQHGAAVVEWQREEIAVRPRRGWRPNTVYTVTMLPGLADLRGNVRREGAATLFATGAVIPPTTISGTLFDWAAGSPVALGLVQAIAPDSTIYLTFADSAGGFSLRHLPAGTYSVKGVVDANRNRALDPRERWDSATVNLSDTGRVDLYAFAHDSLGPRILSVAAVDSITLRVQFDVPVDARVGLDPSWIRVLAPDSTALVVASVSLPPPAPMDTLAPPPNVTQARMARPRPYTEVVIEMAAPLTPGATYTVVANGFPGLLGRVTPSAGTARVSLPAAASPPTPP